MTMDDVIAGRARCAVVCGDAAEVLRTIGDGVAAAVVTDPPAGIAFMGAEWDGAKGGRAQWVAWLAGILADARRCTRDGGRSVVWSLPRTSHWTGCAVEDAGWSIETTITHLQGQSWPKASSQLKPSAETWWLARNGRSEPLNIDACRVRTDDKRAAVFSGAKGEQQAEFGAGTTFGNSGKYLSEPHEGGRWPSNVVFSHASGCTRVGTRRVATGTAVQRNGGGQRLFNTPNRRGAAPDAGYADADGQEEVEAWECCEGCPVAELDAQSGSLTSGTNCFVRESAKGRGNTYGARSLEAGTECITYGDTGGASRFFPCFPADPAVFRYVGKPSSAEKGMGVGGRVRLRRDLTPEQRQRVLAELARRGVRP